SAMPNHSAKGKARTGGLSIPNRKLAEMNSKSDQPASLLKLGFVNLNLSGRQAERERRIQSGLELLIARRVCCPALDRDIAIRNPDLPFPQSRQKLQGKLHRISEVRWAAAAHCHLIIKRDARSRTFGGNHDAVSDIIIRN